MPFLFVIPQTRMQTDVTIYRMLVGSLQYLNFTRPDISFSVNTVCQSMQQPKLRHFQMVKRILRYLKVTINVGHHILAKSDLSLSGYSNSDWAGCKQTRRSTTGFCTKLGVSSVSWSAKKQTTVARSNTEAEYPVMATTTAEILWLTYLLKDLGIRGSSTPVLYCNNVSALYLSVNPIFHARTKHIAIDYHFVRVQVALKNLETRHVFSDLQIDDIFTKPLMTERFHQLCFKLGICSTIRLEGG